MPGENKTLYLFTAGYPYGFKDEPFLENEIGYLSKAFDSVVIFPRSKPTEEKRKTAENVFINDCLNKTPLKNKKRSLLFHPLYVLKVISSSSLSLKHIFSFWNHFRFLIDLVSIGIIQGKALERELSDNNLDNIVFYDYWFFNSIFAISYLKSKKKISKFICRGHGYDIYEENWRTADVPFLRFRINQVDELHLISQHGFEHVSQRVSKKHLKKLSLSYLGVKKPGDYLSDLKKNETYTIVSCARVVKLKKIHEIPSILKKMNIKLKWIHFGDGPYMNQLKENLHDLPDNITVELKGHVANPKVLAFYHTNPIDAFISLSSSEGLPVSMMEALSYGIPIVSLNVGGIREIVKAESGLLLEKDISAITFSQKLEQFIVNKTIDRTKVIPFFDKNFNAEKNYTRFIEKITTANTRSF